MRFGGSGVLDSMHSSNSSAAASPIWKVLGGNPVMVKSALQQTEEQETIETFQK
jgi:hypothetical protein